MNLIVAALPTVPPSPRDSHSRDGSYDRRSTTRAGRPAVGAFFPNWWSSLPPLPLWLSIAFPRLIDATAKATRKNRSTVSLDAERGEKINGKAMDALCGTPLSVACWLNNAVGVSGIWR